MDSVPKNKSLWEEESGLPHFPPQQEDIHTDVLIIGGGMTGILTAYFLQENGVDYALVERDGICSGTTHNTTAKLTVQHGLIYHQIIKKYGTEAAQQYYLANKNALDIYAKLCSGIDCDFERRNNYVYSEDDRKSLEYEIAALEKVGCPSKLCHDVEVPVKNIGAVKVMNQAQFNPLKFISHISKGLNIYENTFVREMIGTTAVTNHGKIYAKKVIVATHFPFINKHGSYYLKLYQSRSYVIALENAQSIDGMYVSDNEKGYSFRSCGEYLLLGGGGHRTGKRGTAWEDLRLTARLLYPNAREAYFWAAQDCMSLDKIPYIGHYSASTPNLYVATGFNKWGMTSSMAAAVILTDAVLGKVNECAKVFSPSRSILQPQLLTNGFEAAKGLLTFSGKRCPHMGCALKWNSAEGTWDCPCHGSRFAGNGRVIDNPSNGNLY